MELIGADVARVYATVIPPSFDPKTEIRSWNQLKFAKFDLGEVRDGNMQLCMLISLHQVHIR